MRKLGHACVLLELMHWHLCRDPGGVTPAPGLAQQCAARVACFASTALAADQILQHGLPMGTSKVTLASILCLTIFRSSDYSSPYTAPPMAFGVVSADTRGC